MSSFKDCLTADGQSLFASMTKGRKVTFTKIVIGDGILPPGETEYGIKDVIQPRCTLPVESVTKMKDNKVCVRARFTSSDAASFYFREKGVYATDGEKEYLVFYANNRAYAEWIDKGSSQIIEKIIRTIVSFSDSDRINITISNSESGPPTIQTNYITIEDFAENNTVDVGTEVILPNGDIYIFNGDEYVQIYGSRVFIVMNEYIEPAKRKKGSLYLQLGKTRRLIIRIFTKYLKILPPENGNEVNTLYFREGKVKTDKPKDDGNYRFICKNLHSFKSGEEPERIPGELYLKIDEKKEE
ncbi:MAG: phage tail protein [Bacillus sp. (in: Bacteria)]|nr:phage tail protein [Bacillus sp. (in: firmicutes)]MCM1427137.1 phage tail protein [Eubacterium sp.]